MLPISRLIQPLSAAILALLVASCAAPAPRPALVAKSETGSYGYSETKLSDSRYEIVYESPSFSVPVARGEREVRLQRERQRAYDFALWRAAQSAEAKGYPALSVEQDRRDVDVSLQTEPSPHLWPGFYRPYYPYPYRYRPWGLYDDDCCWPGYAHYQRWASARITVTLQVKLLNEAGEGALVVGETLSRLSSSYGTPTYP